MVTSMNLLGLREEPAVGIVGYGGGFGWVNGVVFCLGNVVFHSVLLSTQVKVLCFFLLLTFSSC